jgi:hypothetical protein
MCILLRLRHGKIAAAALVALCFLFPGIAGAAERQKQQVRLGTAAAPFGWATAIADLDSDEKLDFAIADRTSYGANGYNYRLQLTLSQAESQTFQFHSTDSALNVSIIDLDNDADLDVVLTHAISGEIAGVWLNNGSGDFQQGKTEDFVQAGLSARRTNKITTAIIPPALVAVPLQKKFAAAAGRVTFDRLLRTSYCKDRESQRPSIDKALCSLIAPRAPPAILPL